LARKKLIGVGVGIGIGIEGQKAGFGHAKPDVFRTSIAYVGWSIVTVREDQPQYTVGIDPDPDSDPDTDGNQEQTDCQQPAQAAAKPRLSQTMKKCPNPRHWQLVASVAQQQEASRKSPYVPIKRHGPCVR
jgi:hypothetical protein